MRFIEDKILVLSSLLFYWNHNVGIEFIVEENLENSVRIVVFPDSNWTRDHRNSKK
jgi:hypothetical protein